MLESFLTHVRFPAEAAAHIRILQYSLGPQSLVYAAGLSIDGSPSLEITIHAAEFGRSARVPLNPIEPTQAESQAPIGGGILQDAATALQAIEYTYFGIQRGEHLRIPSDAQALSFDLELTTYSLRLPPRVTYHRPAPIERCTYEGMRGGNSGERDGDRGRTGEWDSADRSTQRLALARFSSDGREVALLCPAQVPPSSPPSTYFWKVEHWALEVSSRIDGVGVSKLDAAGATSACSVGLAATDFLQLLQKRKYPAGLIRDVSQLPNLDHAPLEFCDTVHTGGGYAQSVFRGLV